MTFSIHLMKSSNLASCVGVSLRLLSKVMPPVSAGSTARADTKGFGVVQRVSQSNCLPHGLAILTFVLSVETRTRVQRVSEPKCSVCILMHTETEVTFPTRREQTVWDVGVVGVFFFASVLLQTQRIRHRRRIGATRWLRMSPASGLRRTSQLFREVITCNYCPGLAVGVGLLCALK